jgi:PKHD-type hydroxylase
MINNKPQYYWMHNLYSKQECLEIIEATIANQDEHSIDVGAPGKNVHVMQGALWKYDNILQKFFYNINSINRHYFNFDLSPIGELSNRINLNFYDAEDKNEYPMHRDAYPNSPFLDTKLTAILNVSQDDYEGGDFEFFVGNGNNGKVPEIHQPGTLLVFPSWLYHRVAPVTKGVRISLSYWCIGPNFK